MRHFWFWMLCIGVAACGKSAPADGAVRVSIKYGSYVPVCLRVTASDGLEHVEKVDILRATLLEKQDRIAHVAVFRKPAWGRELTIDVASMPGSDSEPCSGEALEEYSTPEPITVPLKDFATVIVTLQARDDDGDGHLLKTAEVSGTDCDDTKYAIHPGVPEACGGAVDFDCDGQPGCADTECIDQACDDGNACTSDDQCVAVAGAAPRCQGMPKSCQPSNLVCYTSESSCDPATGVCSFVPKDSGERCSDLDSCTENDRCNGSGECTGETASPCTPRNECWLSKRDCPGSGQCVEEVNRLKIGQPCTEAGQSGWCSASGNCSVFRFPTSNFDPALFPKEIRDLDVRISCGTQSNPVVFDSSHGQWLPPEGCALPPMPEAQFVPHGDESVAVVPMKSLTIESKGALKLKGHRPVIFAVYGSADINGPLLADADWDAPGAGGNRPGCGTQKGGNGPFSSNANRGSGGGGGAFGQNGAMGGSVTGNVNGGKSGEKFSSTLVPLIGGCPGGSGGTESNTSNGGLGGAGGGALQLAVAGTLNVNSWVSVSGGGGRGGKGSTNNAGGGGGGGSGGGLLLDAWRLQLTPQARLTANGGSGAEGGDSIDNTQGADGTDGYRSVPSPAPGGDGNGRGAAGGNGGTAGMDARDGGGAGTNGGAGGGGGGVGIILLRGVGGCQIDQSCNIPDSGGCVISPKPNPVCN